MRLLLTLVLSASVMAAASRQGPPPGGRSPAQQPGITFRVEVNYVEVDAVVTDPQGRFVRGLTQDDFAVLEDGKPQAVSAFSLVDVPLEREDPPLFSATAIEPDVASNRGGFTGRVFLLVLDDLHTDATRTNLVRAAARQFVRRHVGANDLVAIFATGTGARGAQEFTGSRPLLIAAIDKFMGRRTTGIPEPEQSMSARNTYSTLRAAAEYLGGIRGRRKAIVWFGDGIDYDINDPFRQQDADVVRREMLDTIGAATRANVSFYGVDARGLSAGLDEAIDLTGVPDDPGGMVAVQDAVRRAQDSFRTVSTETGGFAVVSQNDLNGAFRRIVADNSSYYVLGYYSTNTRLDGRFRSLDVRVKTAGLSVRARKGYTAARTKPADPAPRGREATMPQAVREAIFSPVPASSLPFDLWAAPFTGPSGKASVAVVVEVDPSRLQFVENAGLFAEDVEVHILALGADGKVVDGDKSVAPMRLGARTHSAVAANGVRITDRLQLRPGRYQIRVAVRESNGGTIGSVFHDLDVPDFSAAPLTMSGISLSTGSSALMPTVNPDEGFKGVLPSDATARREFIPSDTLSIFAEVYDNVTSPAHRVLIKLSVIGDEGRVAYTTTDERRSDELKGARGGYGYTASLPLDRFSPGRYVLRLEGQSTLTGGGRVARELEFRIR